MSRRNHGGKITLGMLKGKPITTSVPSIAIRFHAGGEELEELYPSEDDEKSEKSEKSACSEKVIIEEKAESVAGESNKHESSPMRDYLNKFGKRSSSIDTGINESTATSDPWRLFSEFKGKLTKTVEEKLSEIKSKSNENESSPKHHKNNDKAKTNTNSKENSSVSDSEEQSFSECSIPRSSGLNSTAEDIEMSSDDENSLAESDKTPTESLPKEMVTSTAENNSPTKSKKHFFRHKNKEPKSYVKYSVAKDSDTESQVKITSLLTTVPEKDDDNTPAEDEVESGVEAYEEFTSSKPETLPHMKPDSETLVAPTGFFDMRQKIETEHTYLNKFQNPLFWTCMFVTTTLFFILPIPNFLYGFLIGVILTAIVCYLYYILKLKVNEDFSNVPYAESIIPKLPILEIQAVKEYQPVTKFEGWINEYPEEYEPQNYHIMQTQTVFLKLEGNILRIYNTRAKIPKRAMWNEQKHEVAFTHVRIYNLKSSKIKLLPSGLIPKRLWSKKYPICILLNKEKMNEDLNIDLKNDTSLNTTKSNVATKNNEIYTDPLVEHLVDAHIDEDEIKEMIADESDFFSDPIALAEDEIEIEKSDTPIITDDWDTLNLDDTSNIETKLYFFARTCRDKEEWYRRFVIASRDPSTEEDKSEENLSPTPNSVESVEISCSGTPTPPVVGNNGAEDGKTEASMCSQETATSASGGGTPRKSSFVNSEEDFMRYMARFQQVHKTSKVAHAQVPKRKVLRFRKTKHNTEEVEDEKDEIDSSTDKNNIWLNFFIARIFYDVCQHDKVLNSFLTLIQRKLSTIKLPYFIEDIVMTDLSVGKGTPLINHIYEPRIDEKGLWIFMDIVYEGVTSMAIETKLNLMKLKELAGKKDDQSSKEPSLLSRNEDKSPIYHSDVEDSAESSDDEATSSWAFTSSSPASTSSETNPNSTPRKPSATGGRKFLLMVDKIASSKYFQQATEIKYIKRAMEGVSNTEIKLSVEIQYLSGTLAINIPSPPSDRVWVGFRGNPDLHLSAHPAFGERSINFMHVTKWIEKKLAVEFQKFFVLPNMEDFVLPILIPKLPE